MEQRRGIIDKVVVDGKHGPYAVASVENLGMVTFSLSRSVWKEKGIPEYGMYVILSDLRKKRAGWRAMRGRFVRPSDEQATATSNQKPPVERKKP